MMPGFVLQSLKEILNSVPFEYSVNQELINVEVRGIVYDSREVQPGFIFVALEGLNVDAHQYIPNAVNNGAIAIVGTKELSLEKAAYIRVKDARLAMAYLSAAFYRFPARRMRMVGVTGTDGKTTTANLIYQILLKAGFPAGIISTVNAVIGNEVIDTGFHVTTPEAPEVQRYLNRMTSAGITHVILETTSHGLAQNRVAACEFDISVVTNITHEHLDYHGSYEEYWKAKARLFTGLSDTHAKEIGNMRLAVLNRDDESYSFLRQVVREKIYTYGLHPEADVRAEEITFDPDGLHFTVVCPEHSFNIDCNLIGNHNVSNCLAAITVALYGLNIPPMTIQQGIKELKGIPGRSEKINKGQNFIAIVDFAHTPNALRRVLETVRKITLGKVIAVFGSAGLRDREKRRLMAEIAVDQADFFILTAEDPRTEKLEDILQEMADAAKAKGAVETKTFLRVADRGDAIRKAISMASPGDVVIACGKGHEQSMCFGTIEYAWDDRTAMKAALCEHLEIDGPEMPYLPTRVSQ
jgi:UDP-N-acetylmuramoyl-L-alanyl-D-glutamate--2,6-diaminopimelate ligase